MQQSDLDDIDLINNIHKDEYIKLLNDKIKIINNNIIKSCNDENDYYTVIFENVFIPKNLFISLYKIIKTTKFNFINILDYDEIIDCNKNNLNNDSIFIRKNENNINDIFDRIDYKIFNRDEFDKIENNISFEINKKDKGYEIYKKIENQKNEENNISCLLKNNISLNIYNINQDNQLTTTLLVNQQ